jgi:hypothetical protein
MTKNDKKINVKKSEKKDISVAKAISRGQFMVNLPAAIVMFGTLGLCFYLAIQEILPFWIIPLSFLLAFIFAWLCWSILITKWRLWAFANVRNVHHLKKVAIQDKLIWSDDSFFEKTEIRSAKDKQKLIELHQKFEKEDVFINDINVPEETIIYYSKVNQYLEMMGGLVISGCGIALLNIGNEIIGFCILGGGIFWAYKAYDKANDKNPQIILNEEGIQTASTKFWGWKNIKNEETVMVCSGKRTRFFLTYSHPAGEEKLEISEYATNYKALNNLLIVYRSRYKAERKK